MRIPTSADAVVAEPTTVVDLLRERAAVTPERTAFEFVGDVDADPLVVDYRELDRRAARVATALRRRGLAGERAVLLFPPGIDYVAAFFGCLYASVVAVPVYLPVGARDVARMLAVAADADAAVLVSTTAIRGGLTVDADVSWLLVDDLTDDADDNADDDGFDGPYPSQDVLAFLQYTSGSTGSPKGVMVGHSNLTANLSAIGAVLGVDADSRAVSWLPPYHDMGLIGGIMQPIHGGFPCTLLTPSTFLRRPLRWLAEISRTRATLTAAPDFGYRECALRATEADLEGLDLSSLRHAMVGAEPVRAGTLDAFATRFASSGFRRSALHPCYGLAEATLLVTGGTRPDGPVVVEVDRRELSDGLVRTDPPTGQPSVALTGCGRAQRPDVVAVLDADGRDRPPGTVGEIWVSGPGVTDGYWGRPAETAARFGVELPGHPGRAFLRTGDLGFLVAGELFVTGRASDLMVVRGRNHHPEDVEHTARGAHSTLATGRCAAFCVDDGDEEHVVLVHEVAAGIAEETAAEVVTTVRAAVSSAHGVTPRHVVLVRPGAIPRTTSGKVRRSATRQAWLAGGLRSVAGTRTAGTRTVLAANQDDTLSVVVAAAIGVDAVPEDEPLVGLGLDSLRAVRLVSAIATEFGVEIDATRVLDAVTLTGLRALVADAPPVAAVDDGAPVASRAQQAIWLLDSMGAGSAYHVHGGVRLSGPVDTDRLGDCLDDLLARHRALRSVFARDANGALTMTVLPPGRFPLRRLATEDGAAVDAALHELVAAPFDLTAGPLVRAVLIQRPHEWYLGVAAHHIAVDGWSLGLLMAELGAVYRGEALPPVRPVGPARWTDADAEYWRTAMDGGPPLDLPLDASPRPSWRGGAVDLSVDVDSSARLAEYAARRGVTSFLVLFAALAVVAGRWSGQQDFVLGATSANRDRSNADQVGLFASVLPVRVDLPAGVDFAGLVDQLRARWSTARAHRAMPFDEIVRQVGPDRSDGRAPLVRAVLTLQNLPIEPWQAGGVRAEALELPAPGAQFELSVQLTQGPDGALSGRLAYAAELLAESTAWRFRNAFLQVLRTVVTADGVPVTDLPLQDDAEYARLVDRLSGARIAPARPDLLHALFERRVDTDPGAVAVLGERTLSYGELEVAANRLAWLLREHGVGQERMVAVCLPRGVDLVVALLGVLKAGGCYVPLDQDNPATRLITQVDDVRPVVVVTDDRFAATFPARTVVRVADALDRPAHRPDPLATPASLVYAIHTSGTTGLPKAAMNEHAALVNRIRWMQAEFGLVPGERVLHKTPIGFDVAGWELFWPLAVGATVVLARPDGHRDAAYLARLIAETGVSTCHFVPSMLRAFVAEPAVAECAGVLRRVVCSGEELPGATVQRLRALLPDLAVHNLYGPTEAAIDVTAVEITEEHLGRRRLPIGRPVTGARVYVLDRRGVPVPVGVPGELHLGGVAVGRGYVRRPALTAQRFVPDPFRSGGRLYRTGDLARWTDDGELEFLGRLDHQVKIRGSRVEPAETEAALAGYPGVVASVVVARPGPDGEARLVAYLDGTDAPDSALRAYLTDRLPPAAVPSAFVRMGALPTGRNGKLDRAALPEPVSAAERVAPRDPVERDLAAIWAELLGVPEVSVTAGFFELGGHSLLANRILARVRGEFGVELSVRELLDRGTTVADLAELVRGAQLAAADPDELRMMMSELVDLTDEEVAALLGEDQATPRRTDGD